MKIYTHFNIHNIIFSKYKSIFNVAAEETSIFMYININLTTLYTPRMYNNNNNIPSLYLLL